ncbi:MAG: hypothetical protein E8D52_12620 [Nitrospira sp.]|nr:MAG: hypothetical protein E8D52_12620 [Nitrospira sp.]
MAKKKQGSATRTSPLFAYCTDLELTLIELLGPKGRWNGLAGAFQNHQQVRRAILDATQAIRKRLMNLITADDRLRLTTDIHLDQIERLAKDLKADGQGLLPLLGNFIHLTALLLGYDWLAGKPNREVIYYQNREQQIIDDEQRHPNSNFLMGKIEHDTRVTFIKDLHSKGMRISQIARVLNQTETFVKNVLVRQGIIARQKNVKRT